jgi:PAT family acetyl-CoA transporter-like MFS transporter 1
VFLALNSEEFSNKYLRSPENSSDVGVMPLGTYMIFWSLMYIVVTAWLLIVKTEVGANVHMSSSSEIRTETNAALVFLS